MNDLAGSPAKQACDLELHLLVVPSLIQIDGGLGALNAGVDPAEGADPLPAFLLPPEIIDHPLNLRLQEIFILDLIRCESGIGRERLLASFVASQAWLL